MERKISSKTNKNMGKKIFKKLAFMGLAVCMGALTLFGTACTPTQGQLLPKPPTRAEMTTEQGLITPHKNDPTLYTTESGIEIKYGLSTPTIQEALGSGNLAGFPYFTTTKSSTTYTWVIIGIAPDLEGSGKFESLLFSDWKEKTKHVYAQYFKNNIYETTTPAGSAINSSSGNSYVMDYTAEKFPGAAKLVSDDEIPAGSMLCLLNTTTGNAAYSTQTYTNSDIGTGYYCSSAAGGFGGSANNLTTICKNYYTNDSFGFGTYKSSLQTVSISSRVGWWSADTATYGENYLTQSVDLCFFPLGHDETYDNFRFSTYLTANEVKLTSNVWLRSMPGHDAAWYINTSGVATEAYLSTRYYLGYSYGVRPACVISLS